LNDVKIYQKRNEIRATLSVNVDQDFTMSLLLDTSLY